MVNRFTDARTDEITVYPHVFTGCSLDTRHDTAKERSTAKADRPTNKVRFPLENCPGFCPPDAWAKLAAAKKAACWTLDAETVIVQGGVPDVSTWAQVQAIRRKFAVTGWHDWTDTAFPHYYAEGT